MKSCLRNILFGITLLGIYWPNLTLAQDLDDYINSEINRWLQVGELHQRVSSIGIEVEGSGEQGQVFGLHWPAQFHINNGAEMDVAVGKSMWIGTTNYPDRYCQPNRIFDYKVVSVGPKAGNYDLFHEIMPFDFRLIRKFVAPTVLVDKKVASELQFAEEGEHDYAPDQPYDRMIITKMHTSIGITVTRKVMAFSQQYHNNYLIYELKLKNTGIIDRELTTVQDTLEGVVLHFAHRYAPGHEAFSDGFFAYNNPNWGRNTLNHVIWQDPDDPGKSLRGQYSWWGPHSSSADPPNDYGAPNYNDGRLGGVRYVGTVTLHADKSETDKSDDLTQPSGTVWFGSDEYLLGLFNQCNAGYMTRKYEDMTGLDLGIDPDGETPTHYEAYLTTGNVAADAFGSDAGGYGASQGFGPYTLLPGDSVRIVYAEGVSGISRAKSVEVGRNWYLWRSGKGQPTLIDINGEETEDYNTYKNQWVLSGEDSILQTFRRAIENFNSGYNIPQPPPPPDKFIVESGGDRISLKWSANAELDDNFDGYEVYRAMGSASNFFEKIKSFSKSEVANIKDGDLNRFDDMTASRGLDYFYYVVSKDNGSTNIVSPGVPLLSSKYYTMTNVAATLQRPAERTLSKIRVVPNPWHIKARGQQFGKEISAIDRLGFFGLPPECLIKIYSERGDLIKTIKHTSGTGDELWHLQTSSGQTLVSGVYIAYFEIPRDYIDPITKLTVYRKGENIIRKFVVIR